MLRSSLIVLLALVSIQLVCGSDEKIEGKSVSNGKPHDLHIGARTSSDTLLDQVEIKAKRRWLRWTKDDYKFPNDHNTDYEISVVDVQNVLSDSDGGYPIIKSGGPGLDHVNIHFESRWNKGFDFEVTVYGKKK